MEMTQTKLEDQRRLPVLDGARATSIILVLAAHMLPLGPKALQLNYAAGAMGMSLFFALSGFLITTTLYENPSVRDFLLKRSARILPLCCGYGVVVCLMITFHPSSFFATVAFILNYWPEYMTPGLTNHLWSLCVEVHFYIIIAVVFLLVGPKGLWLVWPACVLVTCVRVRDGALISIMTHQRVDEILIGACIATLWRSDKIRPSWQASPVAILIVIAAWFITSGPYIDWLQYLRPYACGTVLLCMLSQKQGFIKRSLSSKSLRYVARISYALYVVHPLTVHGWFNQGGIVERYLVKRPLSFLMTIGIAHISTFYWERSWTDAARRWIKARHNRYARTPA